MSSDAARVREALGTWLEGKPTATWFCAACKDTETEPMDRTDHDEDCMVAEWQQAVAAFERLTVRVEHAEEALGHIYDNARSWHGIESQGTGAQRALEVIAAECEAALAVAGTEQP